MLSIESMAMKIEQWVRRIGAQGRERGILFRVNPILAIHLKEEKEEETRELAEKYGLKLEVVEDPRMHREEFEIQSLDGKRDLKTEFI